MGTMPESDAADAELASFAFSAFSAFLLSAFSAASASSAIRRATSKEDSSAEPMLKERCFIVGEPW